MSPSVTSRSASSAYASATGKRRMPARPRTPGASIAACLSTGSWKKAWNSNWKPTCSACVRNEQGLVLDLKKPEGVEVFLRLASTADVIIESFRPGVVDKLGIGYDTVRALNPKITYCAISGYGQTGPYRELAGHDINYLGYAGVLDQIGCEDSAPAIPNLQIADLLGGALTAAMGILAAVLDAQRHGEGRYVDVSMTDSVLAHSYFAMLRLNDAGHSAPRGTDLLTGGLPCYATYRCADGRYMAVGALEGKFWQQCCATLGHPEWVARQWDGSLRGELAALFASQPRDVWAGRFAATDCCVTPVLTPEEALENAQLRARGMIVEADGLPQFAPPLQVSAHPFAIRQPAPRAGEHTDEILEAAGIDAAERARLKASGAIR